VSHADGLSVGNEVRGPVAPPTDSEETRPATVTWKNDDPSKPDPRPEDLRPQMRQSIENIKSKTPELESIEVNSGRRPGDPATDPHADGRAVDINKVNNMPVRFAVDPAAPEDKREMVRRVLRNMEAVVRRDVNVQVFISPIGGFHRDFKTWKILREATREELSAHWDHIHMATFE
jgi:hypothetical protein